MQCKHRCVNFRRVSHPRRAFWPAFRIIEITDDWYRSTMGVIVISLGTPRSAVENLGCRWEHLGAPMTSLEAPATCLEVLPMSLGEPQTTEEQTGKATPLSGLLLVHLEILANMYHSMIVNTCVFRLHRHLCIYVSMYLCIYIATHLHTVYLNSLQVVLESNLRCACQS